MDPSISSDSSAQLRKTLDSARFEVLPLKGVEKQVAYLPRNSTVTVTSSPKKGIEATLDLAGQLSSAGYHVVPHLAARLVEDSAHLKDILDRVDELRLREVFVVAGDANTPAGSFVDALALLRGMDDLGRMPPSVGITGYPEPHSYIADQFTIRAMADKAAYASYIVSQICYDPNTVAAWALAVRARGIKLPIYVGLPGLVDTTKLMRISMKIGLGDSMRFLRKQQGLASRLVTGYTPDELLRGLAPHLTDAEYGIAGWHFFTFNDVANTHLWRLQAVQEYQGVPA